MKKLFIIISLCMTILSSVVAQKLTTEFSVAASDLTAQSHSRNDLNGKRCAVVKIEFVGDIINVEGNVVGEIIHKTNEAWVYMPQNSRQLKVITKDYLPLMVTFSDYGIERLESGMTYVLTLVKPRSANNVTSNTVSYNSSSSSSLSGNTISIPVKDGISIEMVKVEAGNFMMGATSEMKDPLDNEKPVHRVTLTNDYYIGKYEVTQKLWQAVMGSNPSYFKGNNLPVEQVSWNDCQEFIRKLNSLTGRRFRLPTEAEWEYAARGGNKSRGYQYSGSNNLDAVAWYHDNSGSQTHMVGIKQPNELGLYDMSGNVCEWCQDWYGSYSSSSQTNPTGPMSGSNRVFRGGSWIDCAWICRLSWRNSGTPDGSHGLLGLRLCLSE